MKKLLFVFPIVALMASGCNSPLAINNQSPITQTTGPSSTPTPTGVQQNSNSQPSTPSPASSTIATNPSPTVPPQSKPDMTSNQYAYYLDAQMHLLTPPDGSQLCLGQPLDIKWEVPADLTAVSLFINLADNTGTTYKIGTFPSSYGSKAKDGKGHYVWTIGDKQGNTISPGAAYHLILTSTSNDSMKWALNTNSPGSFTVNDCLNPSSPKY